MITGIAGILTAIVGLVTVSTQAGWLKSNSKSNNSTATSSPSTTLASTPGTTSLSSPTLLPGLGGGSATTSPVTTSPSHLAVSPPTLTFSGLGPRDQVVTVSNGGTAAVSLSPPAIQGLDAGQFTISKTDCSASLGPGRSCDVQVTYLAKQAAQNARLVISPASAPSIEVPLSGTLL